MRATAPGSKGRRAFCSGLVGLSSLAMGCRREDRPLIFAASSLGPVLRHLLHLFARPADLQLAGSQALRAQIEFGARPDLFFSADAEALTILEGSGFIESRREFATTTLVFAARPGFAGPPPTRATICELDARWVLASADAPLGRYSDTLLREMGLDACLAPRVISRDPSASASLGRLHSGDADLAITYRSLVAKQIARPRLNIFDIPFHNAPRPRYLLAQLRGAHHPEFARAFGTFLEGERAYAILPEFGLRAA